MTTTTMIEEVPTNSLSRKATATAIRRVRSSTNGKPMIVPARGDEGTNTWGMYCEIVHISPSTGAAARHTRYFVYGNHMFAASLIVCASKAT